MRRFVAVHMRGMIGATTICGERGLAEYRVTLIAPRVTCKRCLRMLGKQTPIEEKRQEIETPLTIADYEEVLADARRLTRELSIALHGEQGAAKQASLCDLIEPARRLRSVFLAAQRLIDAIDLTHGKTLNVGELWDAAVKTGAELEALREATKRVGESVT